MCAARLCLLADLRLRCAARRNCRACSITLALESADLDQCSIITAGAPHDLCRHCPRATAATPCRARRPCSTLALVLWTGLQVAGLREWLRAILWNVDTQALASSWRCRTLIERSDGELRARACDSIALSLICPALSRARLHWLVLSTCITRSRAWRPRAVVALGDRRARRKVAWPSTLGLAASLEVAALVHPNFLPCAARPTGYCLRVPVALASRRDCATALTTARAALARGSGALALCCFTWYLWCAIFAALLRTANVGDSEPLCTATTRSVVGHLLRCLHIASREVGRTSALDDALLQCS